jgi:hypothetical protein
MNTAQPMQGSRASGEHGAAEETSGRPRSVLLVSGSLLYLPPRRWRLGTIDPFIGVYLKLTGFKESLAPSMRAHSSAFLFGRAECSGYFSPPDGGLRHRLIGHYEIGPVAVTKAPPRPSRRVCFVFTA